MREISPKEVERMLSSGTAVNIIDVREAEEVAEGKIPGAVNIPLGLIEFRKQDLDRSKDYVMVCRSGGRSSRAAEYLEGQGYQVINMTGGMLAWEGTTE
ncbi:rhodanese-like domain-containing protein [Paenibacillus lautus]|jgi:rhodanese-related sulfurtransferase|uniref:Rhodanese-like domain-containing protein n=1 Tax=Paenibacillus lautus TaxID=1401 RepID=A0A385TN30_PAELA|nr:rhodanese-like domain-containing protein [Paenibacillus lautus]AYB45063.1 rhodanese-like domain-containing protein [Paenibacillus lautus]MBY0163882.1 rhodanese-like domain-containing protein [Cytobacillus firmus]MCI1778148.1 rhodanese-like domain-containing protein [Paenibacillus lautus]VTR62114.1 rhodanese domain-containing protein [Actinobacillus pleuropneumoniae]